MLFSPVKIASIFVLNAAAAAANCLTDADCAYNGHCQLLKGGAPNAPSLTSPTGHCLCNPEWQGVNCERLTVLPAAKDAGYRSPHGATEERTSSWGGSVLYDEAGGRWHMYAAEMINECGIDYWEPNSRVVHAVADAAEGPFAFQDVVISPFAHEPNAVHSPDGGWVIYATVRQPAGSVYNCSGGAARATGADETAHPPPRHTYMVRSSSPDGPWTEPELVLKANYSIWDGRPALIDTNLAVVILSSGEAVGIWRKCENTVGTVCENQCCTFPHLLLASNWSDPSTYFPISDKPMFDGIKPYGAEDPMVWIDKAGVIHAILHDEQGDNRCTAIGRHAFSDDGGRSWSYASEEAYNGTVAWRGGGGVALYRRERPHMIVDQDGRPLYISNGVQEATDSDRSWTLIQPVQRAEAAVELVHV